MAKYRVYCKRVEIIEADSPEEAVHTMIEQIENAIGNLGIYLSFDLKAYEVGKQRISLKKVLKSAEEIIKRHQRNL